MGIEFVTWEKWTELTGKDLDREVCTDCVYYNYDQECMDALCDGGLFMDNQTPQDSAYQSEENIKPLKYDDNKPMVELVLGDFSLALLEVAKVGTMGAKKYSPHGWRDNDTPIDEKVVRFDDAKGRHRLAYQSGEDCCPESKLKHRAHEAWNVLAALQLELIEELDKEI